MDAKRTPDRDECLRAALSLLAQRAYTFDELACELGIDPRACGPIGAPSRACVAARGAFSSPTPPVECSTGLSVGPGTS